MVIEFGSGVLFAKPVAGNQPTDPTPFKFGVLQEVTVDFKADLKKLYGQYQLAVATARGKLDVTLKGKLAVFDHATAIIGGRNLAREYMGPAAFRKRSPPDKRSN